MISLTEYIQKQSVPGVHYKSISTFDLQEEIQACCAESLSVDAAVSLFFFCLMAEKDARPPVQIPRTLLHVEHDNQILLYTKPLTHITEPLKKPF